MSMQAVVWVLEHERSTEGTARLVLLSIANHANREGTDSWPSIDTIAWEVNRDRRTVQRALQWLAEQGLIEVEVQGGGSMKHQANRRPNRYTILPLNSGAAPVPPQDEQGRHLAHFGAASGAFRGGTSAAQTQENQREPVAQRPSGPPSAPPAAELTDDGEPLQASSFHAQAPPPAYEHEGDVRGDTSSTTEARAAARAALRKDTPS
jgi:DNA-binding transcriptional MocR family regulator